jgi:hypothetical protein
MTGLVLLTKITTLLIAPMVTVILFLRSTREGMIRYLTVTAGMVLPWVAFNLYHYGQVIGVRENLQIISRSLDTQVALDVGTLLVATRILVRDYLVGVGRFFPFDQENVVTNILASLWEASSLGILGYYCWRLPSWWSSNNRTGKAAARETCSRLGYGYFFLCAILLSYAGIVVATVVNTTLLLAPRYTYSNVVAAIFCGYIAVQDMFSGSAGTHILHAQ